MVFNKIIAIVTYPMWILLGWIKTNNWKDFKEWVIFPYVNDIKCD